jgi:spermidine synthase
MVQPMMGKMVLPLLGGTPAVWSACMVFFQAALLAGYAYAHATTAWLGPARQAMLHMAVLALPLAVLPLGLDASRLRGGDANPVLDTLGLLSVSVGLPFFVVSASAPLLQRWFTQTGHPAARDPYFLYAASNLGSMLALLAYPALVEPRLALRGQTWLSQTALWSAGYVILAALTAACALVLWRRPASAVVTEIGATAGTVETGADISTGRRLRWIALSMVPSSLLLGVTTYVTTDLAAIPLLWVLPLAIYLLTFILAFGRWPALLHRIVVTATVPAAIVVLFLLVSSFKQRIWISVLCHFALLFLVALACHGELARSRPPAARLTEFYLLISLGGVLGGIFNALVAPVAFASLVEYPLMMVLACLLLTVPRAPGWARAWRVPTDIGLAAGVAVVALVLYSESVTVRVDFAFLTRILGIASEPAWLETVKKGTDKALLYGPPLVAAFLLRRRPVAFGLGLLAVLAAASYVDTRNDDTIYQARSFFGVLRLTRDRDLAGYTELRHGTTLHGRQSLAPERRREPMSYYHRRGPIGQVFAELDKREAPRRLAMIGLGTGTLAAYARPGDDVTFYEIDRLVVDIAWNPAYFTYLTDARDSGVLMRAELGDARVRMEAVKRERPGARYDLIVVDAFSSDSIPVHLITREAMRLYLDLLAPGGIVAIHISNRHLDLAPVVAGLALDADLRGRLIQSDDEAESQGAHRSTWTVLARAPEDLGELARDRRWTDEPLEPNPRVGIWTDDFHNLLSVFKW